MENNPPPPPADPAQEQVPDPAPAETANPQQEPAAPPPQKKRSVLKILLIIIGVFVGLVIILAAAAFYYLQSQGLTPDKLNPEPKAPQTTIAPRDVQTNTYSNHNYKFSMPIDKELQVKESPYGFGVTSVEMRSPDTPDDYGPDVQLLIFPKGLGGAIGQDFDKLYALPDNTPQDIKDPSGGTQNFTKVRNRDVKGLRAFEFISKADDPEYESEIGLYIEMGSDLLIMNTGESNRDKLEEMLANFTYPLKK